MVRGLLGWLAASLTLRSLSAHSFGRTIERHYPASDESVNENVNDARRPTEDSSRPLLEHRAEDRVGEQESDVVRPFVVEWFVRKRGEHRAEAFVGALAEFPVGEDLQVVAADAPRGRALRIHVGPSRAASWPAPRAPARAPCSRSWSTRSGRILPPSRMFVCTGPGQNTDTPIPSPASSLRRASESPITAALAVM